MNRGELEHLLNAFPGIAVGVIGDFCLDVYWEIDNTIREVSIETGREPTAVRTERMAPGGAGNVALNLAALGVGRVEVFGAIGEDPYGRELLRLLGEAGIDTPGLLPIPERHTHLFVKPLTDGEEGGRIDIGNYNVLGEEPADRLLDAVGRRLGSVDAWIVNQQFIAGSGVHTPPFRTALTAMLRGAGTEKIFVDSRDHAADFPGFVRKMNHREVMSSCRSEGIETGAGAIRGAASALAARWGTPVVVTRGELETLVVRPDGIAEVPCVSGEGGAFDPVGAGDTFIAALAAASAAGGSLEEGAELGNLAAGVTVGKTGQTGTASPAEILEIREHGAAVCSPELAERPAMARHHRETEIEIVRPYGRASGITHAIFDHDGTVSTLREGWERVMEPMMVRCISGGTERSLPADLLRRIEARVRGYIEHTTGVQTLVQMKGLAGLVREFGLVPETDILDEHGYKRIYNDALMERVEERIGKLRRGELRASDFTVAGAVGFLEALESRGVVLSLASGTDQDDVRREAELLGYAGLFEGGIHGSIGRIDVEAKREVLARILAATGSGASIAVFGDGPVEIRECVRSGGFAVGVASDEVRRFGLNASKRRRLIRAGAHIMIPDFTQADRLLEYFAEIGLLAR